MFECRDQGSGIWDPGSWFVVRDPEDPGISDEAIGFFGTRIPDHGSRRGHTGRRYCNTRHHFVRVFSCCQPFRSPFTGGKALTLKVLRVPRAGRHRACDTTAGRNSMFAASLALIGVLGFFIVRRRSARKKQGLA